MLYLFDQALINLIFYYNTLSIKLSNIYILETVESLRKFVLSNKNMFFYQAYGLNICSDFLLPELLKGGNRADIYIQKGKVELPVLEATSIQRQGIEALFGGNAQEAYLRWTGIATLLAKDGITLIVDPDSNDIDPRLLNLYILSEALGLILYQRGLFLLHASAVKIGQQVVIFAGPPGAGKSTTAAAFAQHGYTVLADDMVAMTLRSTGKVIVFPAFPEIKIWPSTVKGLGYNKSSLPLLFSGSQKRVIQQREDFPVIPFPLADIFIFENGANLRFTRMVGIDAFFTLARFFPCPSVLLQGTALEAYFQQCIQLLGQVSIWRVENPKDFKTLDSLVLWVEQQLKLTQSKEEACAL